MTNNTPYYVTVTKAPKGNRDLENGLFGPYWSLTEAQRFIAGASAQGANTTLTQGLPQ